jgi:hypothetical protein
VFFHYDPSLHHRENISNREQSINWKYQFAAGTADGPEGVDFSLQRAFF